MLTHRLRAFAPLMALFIAVGALAQDTTGEPPPAEDVVSDGNFEGLGGLDLIGEDSPLTEDVPTLDAGLPITGEFSRELRTVEESVHNLKERVFRSKATLQLLKELVVEGATLGSRVGIWHINKLGGAYTLESVQYFLDGKNVYSKVDPGGSLGELREIKIREQTVAPGTHTLQVNMVLRGNGMGIFSYLNSYQFKVQSSYSFEIEDGKLTTLRVLASTKGGVRRSFVERPNVQYEERTEQLKAE